MGRLYNAKIIDKRWKYDKINEKNNYPTYTIKDTKEYYSYDLYNIIGFEQVSENEFLVYKRHDYDNFEIVRYEFKKGKKIEKFSEIINGFEFLSSDNLMLTYMTNSATEHVKGIYSISKNNYVPEAKWLDMAEVNEYQIDGKSKLLFSKIVDSENEVIFSIKPKTFEPNGLCYSTLRDSYIKVKTAKDVENLISEDQRYSWNIKEYCFALEKQTKELVKEKLLRKQNKNNTK